MSNEVTMFNFDGSEVRVIADEKGEPWFLAKDVCDILGLTNPTMALSNLDDDERAKFNLGRQGDANIISESGMYSLVMTSRKPEAKKFKKWVTSEVLPSIRKTGSYTVPKSEKQTMIPASKEMRAALSLAKMMGLKGNQAIIHADNAVKKATGLSPIDFLGVDLVAENNERILTVTKLGEIHNKISGQRFNKLLQEKGLQEKDANGNWNPTVKGKKFAVLVDNKKKNSNGSIQGWNWKESVLKELVA